MSAPSEMQCCHTIKIVKVKSFAILARSILNAQYGDLRQSVVGLLCNKVYWVCGANLIVFDQVLFLNSICGSIIGSLNTDEDRIWIATDKCHVLCGCSLSFDFIHCVVILELNQTGLQSVLGLLSGAACTKRTGISINPLPLYTAVNEWDSRIL